MWCTAHLKRGRHLYHPRKGGWAWRLSFQRKSTTRAIRRTCTWFWLACSEYRSGKEYGHKFDWIKDTEWTDQTTLKTKEKEEEGNFDTMSRGLSVVKEYERNNMGEGVKYSLEKCCTENRRHITNSQAKAINLVFDNYHLARPAFKRVPFQ
ncbi:hypothetical protein PHYBLDRAFT_78206 [Phycomyces blakesleeanus NRRL 1555(-)]|uniref:Uncharacterized protein n=1 Tax=Phycomyces blakesleeanus (strain ATCC 8743b / DSM 1359 / FGSC 10004 / NBRC 33097 / NRRL 1555) TaxID=763407 RepID=A0A162U437_PHYB8|nr:hypothetical protein PHYBLDRAFT_78206 [Phycomyces blakesleeanus NRRL 1555(-)]OAD73272.1 hypothetical protein PHYBLDRAFT_78206 [Phycomyces blakesleeanus NRRL 1555(-)]|eukprot:XP_018291312.1 hypothetical protein PHYBLDRAFT_78206 [Phycomyces blakesleeanus NRRL 1555(-)]